ncbi:MAG: hypothetical protein FWG10_05560 [Eubacteriaceae bacterium]|nr:hypothetical protein [Eubacteriaceae bacterium]
MTEDLQKLYDERVDRFVKTVTFTKPDRVPILSQITNWALHYTGYKLVDVFENYDLEAEIYVKANKDFFFDGVRSTGIGHMLKTQVEYKSITYFISPNGVTNQHHDHSDMTVEEYEELFENEAKLYAKLAQRKLAYLMEMNDDELFAAVSKILNKPKEHAQSYARQAVIDQLGLPIVAGGGTTGIALDTMFDFLRGLKNTTVDLRRRPEKIQECIDFLTPNIEATLPKPGTKLPPFPFPFKMHHIPTFLSADLFGRFYWPYYRKQVELYHDCGTTYVSNWEGLFSQHYDYLQDLPDHSLVGMNVPEEYELWVNRFGGKFGCIAGVPSSTLRFLTPEECIERAKKVVDLVAPHGGMIFGNDRSMIAPMDADPDKLRAMHEFVAGYATF